MIWYQGESDTRNETLASTYIDTFSDVINDWRTSLAQGDFPFLFVNLAGFHEDEALTGRNWPIVREAQAQILKQETNVGMAVAIDLGEYADIHSYRKEEVAERLALVARKQAYGQSIVASGPMIASYSIYGNEIDLHFTHTGSRLVAGDVIIDTTALSSALLEGFRVRGSDGISYVADAWISGSNTVTVSSPSVPFPVAADYAWQDFALCNLYNAEGLPTVPFRTDGIYPVDAAWIDSDGDGMSDADEQIAGTNPQDATDLFQTTAFAPIEPNMFWMEWTTVPGRSYTLWSCPDLTTGTWTQVHTPFIATTNSLSMPITNSAPNMFYHIKVHAP